MEHISNALNLRSFNFRLHRGCDRQTYLIIVKERVPFLFLFLGKGESTNYNLVLLRNICKYSLFIFRVKNSKKTPLPGIEPRSPGWQREYLPLYYNDYLMLTFAIQELYSFFACYLLYQFTNKVLDDTCKLKKDLVFL